MTWLSRWRHAPQPLLEHFPNTDSKGNSSGGGRWLPSFSSSFFLIQIQIQKGILLENARLLLILLQSVIALEGAGGTPTTSGAGGRWLPGGSPTF